MHTSMLHPHDNNMVLLRSLKILVFVLFATGCVSATPSFQTLRSLSAADIFGVKSFLNPSTGHECITENKNPGTCLSRIECSKLDGAASGSCGYSGVCCEISMVCDKVSRAKKTYIHNPSKIPSQCHYYFRPYSKHVCQLRFDFSSKLDSPWIPRSLKSNDYVECRDSYMQIGSFKLCGLNRNQHFYVPFEADKNEDIEVSLRFIHRDFEKSGSNYWDMIVTQLECAPTSNVHDKDEGAWDWHLRKKKTHYDTELIAPEGCLQYYTEPSGTIESFNYNGGAGPYLGNMRYAVCFKKDPGDKKIVFEGIKFNLNSNRYNRDDTNTNCYDSKNKFSNGDYLLIPDSYLKTPHGVYPKIKTEASKYCGTILENREVYYAPAGPFIITVNFDKRYHPFRHIKERGFKIKYSIFTGSTTTSDLSLLSSGDDDRRQHEEGHRGGYFGQNSDPDDYYQGQQSGIGDHYYPLGDIYDYPWHLKPSNDKDDDDRDDHHQPGRPGGGRPGGSRPDSGRPGGSRPDGGRPDGGRPDGGRPGGGRPGGTRPGGGRPSGGRPSGGRPSDGRPSSGRPSRKPGKNGKPGKPFVLFEDDNPEFDNDNDEAETETETESSSSSSSSEEGEDSGRLSFDDDNGGEDFEDNDDDFEFEKTDDDKDEPDDALPDFFKPMKDTLRLKLANSDEKREP